MATTVGSHSVSAFATPVNGGPLDANVVRGNDNTIRTAYVAHDADTGIHVQSSTLANRPTAGTAGRKWITADTGSYKLWYDDGTTWHEVAAGNIDVFVIAGEALAKGDIVKVTGYNTGTGAPTVVKVSSASDTAFGIVTSATIANGATGYITNTGLIQDVNTNAFSINNVLYPNTSGGLTATKPTSGTYQVVAYVLRANQNNGVLYVEFSAPRIVERSNNEASTVVLRDASGDFAAGTITATAINTTTLDLTNLEVTNIKAKDGTASATIADSTGVMTIGSSVLTTTDINGGTIDGTTIGGSSPAVGTFTTLNATTVNTTTLDLTNLEVTNIKAKDGTAAATIADSTGKITVSTELAVDNLNLSGNAITSTDTNGNIDLTPNGTGEVNITKVDIDSGTIDGTTIGGASAAAGTFTTVAATTGNITTVNATTVDATNVEVTNVKAKDGTASITIADSTGALTFSSALADSNLATISTAGKVANSATTATSANTASAIVARDASGNFSAGTITANLTGNISGTAPAGTLTGTTLASGVTASSLTSVGTLTSLTVSGDLTVDTSTLKVDSTNNRVGIDTATPAYPLQVRRAGGAGSLGVSVDGVGAVSRSVQYFAVGDATNVNTGHAFYVRNATATDDLAMVITNTSSVNISGNLAVDTNTLYVDAANNRVGVGTASPSVPFEVVFSNAETTATNSGACFAYAVNTDQTNNNYALTAYADAAGGASSGLFGLQFTNHASNYGDFVWWTRSAGGYTEKLRLDASGNLGLGVTPSVPLHVKAANNEILRLQSSDATTGSLYFSFYDSADAEKAYIGYGSGVTDEFSFVQRENAAMVFFTNASERARITAGGYFKASDNGTYAGSTATYHEFKNTTNDNPVLQLSHAGSSGNQYGLYIDTANDQNDNTRYFLYCEGAATERATIRSNGGLANYSANNVNLASDERLKKDITPLASTWDKLKAMEVVNFRYKDCNDGDPALYGVIAQQVQPIVPELVVVTRPAVEAKDAVLDEDGNEVEPAVEASPEYYGIREQPMYWLAIKALQEAQARIEALEARLEALEA